MLSKDIDKDHEEKILALLELYADVIAIGDNGLGWTGILRHNRYRKCKPYSSASEEDINASKRESQRIAQEHDAEEGNLTIQEPVGFSYCSCPEEEWLNTILC